MERNILTSDFAPEIRKEQIDFGGQKKQLAIVEIFITSNSMLPQDIKSSHHAVVPPDKRRPEIR